MNLYYWLGALYWQGLGIKTLQLLLAQIGDISEIFTANTQELAKLGLPEKIISARKEIDWASVEADLTWGEQPQQYIVPYADERYPELLRTIPAAPLLLYMRGELAELQKPSLAIVGSRQPTAIGKETAFAIAQACATVGLSVCSGLAYGIDAAAHRGVLAGGGTTIAVLGSGLNHIYPRTHLPLSQNILEKQGLLISEFPPKTRPHANNFPKRNRIISGLSVGVLIVEAAAHSGSLITARYALEQGREVFAIPGSIYNHLARGCHLLIRQGAKLVESIQDIVEELTNTVDFFKNSRQDVQLLRRNSTERIATLTPQQQALWHLLDDGPSTLEQLLDRSQMSLGQLRHALIHLELQGYVRMIPGGYQRSWPSGF